MRRVAALGAGLASLALAVAACGGNGDDADRGLGAPAPPGSPAAAGARVAEDRGCTSCHTDDGDDRTGPTWKGLWGSQVELADGTTVTVDRDYLVRAIRDPGADVVDGFTPIMPEVSLTDAEVDELVAHIESLG